MASTRVLIHYAGGVLRGLSELRTSARWSPYSGSMSCGFATKYVDSSSYLEKDISAFHVRARRPQWRSSSLFLFPLPPGDVEGDQSL